MNDEAERFVRWEPISNLPGILDPSLTSPEFGKNGGLHVTLTEPRAGGRVFKAEFTKVLMFRCANESYRLKMIETIKRELPWPAFKIENSEWIAWFNEQTFGVYRDWPVQHFVLLGEDILEVLSTLAPAFVEVEKG